MSNGKAIELPGKNTDTSWRSPDTGDFYALVPLDNYYKALAELKSFPMANGKAIELLEIGIDDFEALAELVKTEPNILRVLKPFREALAELKKQPTAESEMMCIHGQNVGCCSFGCMFKKQVAAEPEAGEFTKGLRKLLERPLTTLQLKRLYAKAREACDRLEATEKRRWYSPKKTWVQYAQEEFMRAEAAQKRIAELEESLRKQIEKNAGRPPLRDGVSPELWAKTYDMNKELEAENKRLKERYRDYERLWEIAKSDNCDRECDSDAPYKRCSECMAKDTINECGEIRDEAIRAINEARKEK